MPDLLVRIKIFGTFRSHVKVPFVEFEAPCGIAISELKKQLAEIMMQKYGVSVAQLIEDSVIASQDAILAEESVLKESVELAILPPVCGG